MKPEDLVPLIRILWPDPEATPGKITLVIVVCILCNANAGKPAFLLGR